MTSLHLLCYLLGADFMTDTVPHVVCCLRGRPFQSPFAQPPGEELSSATLNVLRRFANLAVGYLLVAQYGDFNLRNIGHVAAVGFGMLLLGPQLGRHFKRFKGGNLSERA